MVRNYVILREQIQLGIPSLAQTNVKKYLLNLGRNNKIISKICVNFRRDL